MPEPLDDSYLKWLANLIWNRRRRGPNVYWELLNLLYRKEFVWIIPNDDNRMEDGRELRNEFVDAKRIRYVDQDWMDLGCSFLEMMIGLSRRLSFEADGDPSEWFWALLQNLQLDEYSDEIDIPTLEIDETLERVIWRNYKRNGDGGLFPLSHATRDQRKVEIWYQLNAYLLEKG